MGDEAGDESEARCQGKEKIMLLTSDGKVRILAGARRRDCGMFAALHFDTALFIVEHLGYRSSKVGLPMNTRHAARSTQQHVDFCTATGKDVEIRLSSELQVLFLFQ